MIEVVNFLCFSSNPPVYPLVIAVHPLEPNQLSPTEGAVKVIEPLESEGKWGATVPVENGAANGRTPASPDVERELQIFENEQAATVVDNLGLYAFFSKEHDNVKDL